MELWLRVALIWDFDTLRLMTRASVQSGTWANLTKFITDLVLYPEEGSITQKSVKSLLKCVVFTIFKLRLVNYVAQGF